MRFLYIAVAVIFLAFTYSDTTAQELSKKEQRALDKEWKKKMKAMSPMEYKQLVEDKERLQNETYECQRNMTEMESNLQDKDSQVHRLEKQIAEKEKMEQEALASAKADSARRMDSNGQVDVKGINYRVQIGAFRNKNLAKYTERSDVFKMDEADGIKKYTIGTFVDYWDADKFKIYLRAMGVKDAWVASYRDNERIPMREAREGAIK